jgi:serine phosphatase RsbU (regulator of sigma subunit)
VVHVGDFRLSDMVRASAALRVIGRGASSMEEVAGRIVDYLYDALRSEDSAAPDLALVRFYKTHPFAGLPSDIRDFALRHAEGRVTDSTRCLTLLATRGDEPDWNDPAASRSHRSIALSDEHVVIQAPMIAQLIHQFGLSIGDVVEPDPALLVELNEKTYNVFHVPVARHSPYVPAQQFVEDHGIESALGFGGVLATGDLFAVIMFSRHPISAETAALLRPLALALKAAVTPFTDGPVWTSDVTDAAPASIVEPTTPTGQLLDVHETIALEQATTLEDALEQARRLSEGLSGLVALGRVLGDAQDEREILEIISRQGVALLGAEGAVLTLLEPGGERVRALTTAFFDEGVQAQVSVLPIDFPLPMVHTARTGESLFLKDRAEAVALFPDAAALYEEACTDASCAVVLRHGRRWLGSLAVAWTGRRSFTTDERELLGAFAAMCAQALERVTARQAEREAAAAAMRMSETLQRSLLTEPPQPAPLQIAVRYQPAAHQAQVGGDWYDAFLTPDGGTTLVVGDVTGHDRNAAAAMGQIRNILRGVAQTVAEPPAVVLAALETALHNLSVEALATVVLGQIEQDDEQAAAGERTLRWSNAGHPPPLLLHADGTSELLERPPDLLLGLHAGVGRADHEVAVPAGSTVLLYTDGLVERRGEALDDGVERLRRAAGALAGLPLEQLCDAVLDALGAGTLEDDAVLLAVRLHAENPGPASAP